MRALIQRVSEASVVADGKLTGQIGRGLLVLVAITLEDNDSDIEYLVRKITKLRVFNDEEGKMNLNLSDVEGGILVISQFTLYADTQKGNRPSYMRSAPPVYSIPMYEKFLSRIRQEFAGPVEAGIFGADMKVSLVNDGPVTLMMDSKEVEF